MAAPADLRSWIALLEREGELVRVGAEVDPELEITEVVERTVKAGGPALLFERVRGSEHPLLINQFGTERRMSLALGVESLDDVAGRVADVLEMQPPQGLVEKVRGLRKLKSLADSLPRTVRRAPCQEIVLDEPVDLVQAKTIDLEVPANAEIVLEGYVQQGELVDEGPFGDHTGYYTGVEPFPVFHVTAITMRRDAIYPSIVVGKPPQEDAWLGKATERLFLPAIRATVPEIVDYDLPVAGVFHNCAIVSIRKQFPGHASKVMHAIWGLGMLSLTKCVVVVDAHVDVHDYEQVLF